MMGWLSGWQQHWPWALALVMVLAAWWGEARRIFTVRRWFQRGALERVGWRPTPRTLSIAVGIVVTVAGAFTVARWQEPGTGTLWLLIDQSRSQAAVEPDGRTRWQQAQATLQRLVVSGGQAVGIIVFRADAALLVAPTRDRQSVVQTLEALQPVLDRQASDPAAALRLFERLRQGTDTALLVSDGEWAVQPVPPSVPLIGWGLGNPARVPPVPGDGDSPVSQPDPQALAALCQGHSVWGPGVTVADLKKLQVAGAEGSRSWAVLFLILALIEASLIVGQRNQVRLGQLPYHWVQRWVIWRAGSAAVLAAMLILPAASDVPAWRWHSIASLATDPYNAGCLAAGRGDHAAAEKAWRRSVALDPNWQPGWYNLGTLLAGLPGREKEALQAFAEAVRLDPTDVWAKENEAALRRLTPAAVQREIAEGQSPASPSAMRSPLVMQPGQSPAGAGDGESTMPAGLASQSAAVANRTLPAQLPSVLPGQGGALAGKGLPQALPSLKAADIDRLLGQAEALSPEALRRLRQQQAGGQPPAGELPSLTAEQWARMAALAARMGVQPQDLQRHGTQGSPFVEPAPKSSAGLRW
jgi:tetratricopeptide (TPR) repeat protein